MMIGGTNHLNHKKINKMEKYKNYNRIYEECGTSSNDEIDSGSRFKDPYYDWKYKNQKSDLLPKKEKKKGDKKVFNIGDVVVCTEIKSKKLPQEAIEFLSTFKYFKVIDVNDNYNIDIGYVTAEGTKFYFNPNRFELKDKPKKKLDPYKGDEWDDNEFRVVADERGEYKKITELEWQRMQLNK